MTTVRNKRNNQHGSAIMIRFIFLAGKNQGRMLSVSVSVLVESREGGLKNNSREIAIPTRYMEPIYKNWGIYIYLKYLAKTTFC
jgi:hypothetical protein